MKLHVVSDCHLPASEVFALYTQTLVGHKESFKSLVLWALELLRYLITSCNSFLLPLANLTTDFAYSSRDSQVHFGYMITSCTYSVQVAIPPVYVDHVTSM